jgi:hypothetical protein
MESSAMVRPMLIFEMSLPQMPNLKSLLNGLLYIKDDYQAAGIKCTATSGIAGFQYTNSWKFKGRGCLPPSSPRINYTVSTNRLWLPNVKGVEGSFYAISPFSVNVGGINRGDFGIHYDSNVPGSAGCIVLPIQAQWDTFRNKMQEYRGKGFQAVDLLVDYSLA